MPVLLHEFDALNILATNPAFVSQIGVLQNVNVNSDAFTQEMIDTVVAAADTPIFAQLMTFVALPFLLGFLALFYCCCGMPCCVCCSSQYQFEEEADDLLREAKEYGITSDMTEDDDLSIQEKKYFRLQHQNDELRAKTHKYNYFLFVPYCLWFVSALTMIIFLSCFEVQFLRVFKQDTTSEVAQAGEDLYKHSLTLFPSVDAFLKTSCGFEEVLMSHLYASEPGKFEALIGKIGGAPSNFEFIEQSIDGIILKTGEKVVLDTLAAVRDPSSLQVSDQEVVEAQTRLSDFMVAMSDFMPALGENLPLIDKFAGVDMTWQVAIFKSLCEFGVFEANCEEIDDDFLADPSSDLGTLDTFYRRFYHPMDLITTSQNLDSLILALEVAFGVELPFETKEEMRSYLKAEVEHLNPTFQEFSRLIGGDGSRVLLQLLPNAKMVTWGIIERFFDGECSQITLEGKRINCGISTPGTVVDFQELLPPELLKIVDQSEDILQILSNTKVSIYNISKRMNNIDIGLDTRNLLVILNAVAQRTNQAFMPELKLHTLMALSRSAGVITLAGGTVVMLIVACGCMVFRNPCFSRCSLGCSGLSQLSRAVCMLICAMLALACLLAGSLPLIFGELDKTADAFFAAPEYNIQRVEWSKQLQSKLDNITDSFFEAIGFQVPEWRESDASNSEYDITSQYGFKVARAVVDLNSKQQFLRSAQLKIEYKTADFTLLKPILQAPFQLQDDIEYIICNGFYSDLTDSELPSACIAPPAAQHELSKSVAGFLRKLPAMLTPTPAEYDDVFGGLSAVLAALGERADGLLSGSFELEIGLADRFFEIFRDDTPLLDLLVLKFSSSGGAVWRRRPSELINELFELAEAHFADYEQYNTRQIANLGRLATTCAVDLTDVAEIIKGLMSGVPAAFGEQLDFVLPYAKDNKARWAQDSLSSFKMSEIQDVNDLLGTVDGEDLYTVDKILLFLNDEILGLLDREHLGCNVTVESEIQFSCLNSNNIQGHTAAYKGIAPGEFQELRDFWLENQFAFSQGLKADFTLNDQVFTRSNVLQNRLGLTETQINTLGTKSEDLYNSYCDLIGKVVDDIKISAFEGPDRLVTAVGALWGFEAIRLADDARSGFWSYMDVFAADVSLEIRRVEHYAKETASSALTAAKAMFAPGDSWTLGELANRVCIPSAQLLNMISNDLLTSSSIAVPAERVKQIISPYAKAFSQMHYFYFCMWTMAVLQPILAAMSWPFLSSHLYDKREEIRKKRAEERLEKKKHDIEERNREIISDLEAEGGGVVIVRDQDQLTQILDEQDAAEANQFDAPGINLGESDSYEEVVATVAAADMYESGDLGYREFE